MAIHGSYFYNGRWGEVKKTAARTLAVAMNVTPAGDHAPLWQQLVEGRSPQTLLTPLADAQGKILASFQCRSTWWLNITGDVCSFMGLAYATQAPQLVRALTNIKKELRPLCHAGKADWQRVFRALVSRFLNFIADARPALDAENLSLYWNKPVTPNRLMELGKVDRAMGQVLAIAQQHPTQQSWIFDDDAGQMSPQALLNQLQTDVERVKTAVGNFTRTTPGFLLTRSGELPQKLKNHLFNPDNPSSRQRLNGMIEELHANQPPEMVSFDAQPGRPLYWDENSDNPVDQLLNALEPDQAGDVLGIAEPQLADFSTAQPMPEIIAEPECISSAMALNSILMQNTKAELRVESPCSSATSCAGISTFPGKYLVADDFRAAFLAFFLNEVDDRILVFLIQDILGDTEWGHFADLVNSARSKTQHRLTRQSMEAAFGTSYHRLRTLARQLERIVKDTSEFLASSPGIDASAQYLCTLEARKVDFVARQAEIFKKGACMGEE